MQGGHGDDLAARAAPVAIAGGLAVAALCLLAGPLGADRVAAEAAQALRADWLESAMRAITKAGSTIAILAVAIVATVALAWRGLRRPALVVAAGALLTALTVPILKQLVDRDRPEGGLLDISSPAFPSGHAAGSFLYVVLALVLAGVMNRTPGRVAVLAAGTTLAVLIGASRIYLGVHWLSDVIAGWSVALAIYAGVALAARQDGPP